MMFISLQFIFLCVLILQLFHISIGFLNVGLSSPLSFITIKTNKRYTSSSSSSSSSTIIINNKNNINKNRQQYTHHYSNTYDDWISDAIVIDTTILDEENVEYCLNEFINSDYGQQMFGCNDRAASIGITGSIKFIEINGPEVILQLSGKFWHRRDTVLGKAAIWLNACIPEITSVNVLDKEELLDTKDIIDEYSGEILYQEDKRSPDFNGDRGTMEYQGIDPDVRGPFPQGPMGPGSSMINPA